MAHGRTGPDLVMNTRYAGASEVRAVSIHEEKREPDGSSAIDPDRSELNRLLWSIGPEPVLAVQKKRPKTQQGALEALWASGVKKPAKQSESPYVQIVLSASHEYFRDEGQGPGEWNQQKLDAWLETTMAWLHKEYGKDLIHVSLHLDEDTPHLHVLIVPTYEKKPRRPGKQKRGESLEDFEARKAVVDNAPTIRVAGRASNDYWKKAWARREARKSYHEAVEPLGIGYGKDFVGEKEPSPEHVPTGKWVREQASKLREKELSLNEREEKVIERENAVSGAEEYASQMRRTADDEWALAAKSRIEAEALTSSLREEKDHLAKAIENVREIASGLKRVINDMSLVIRQWTTTLGLTVPKEEKQVSDLQKAVSSILRDNLERIQELEQEQDISIHDPDP
jgi:hypothetical protein